MYGGVQILLHAFLMVALNGSGHLRAPRALPPRIKKAVDTHWGGECESHCRPGHREEGSLVSAWSRTTIPHLVCNLVAMSTEIFYV